MRTIVGRKTSVLMSRRGGQLGTRLADRLGGNDADRFTGIDHAAATERPPGMEILSTGVDCCDGINGKGVRAICSLSHCRSAFLAGFRIVSETVPMTGFDSSMIFTSLTAARERMTGVNSTGRVRSGDGSGSAAVRRSFVRSSFAGFFWRFSRTSSEPSFRRNFASAVEPFGFGASFTNLSHWRSLGSVSVANTSSLAEGGSGFPK